MKTMVQLKSFPSFNLTNKPHLANLLYVTPSVFVAHIHLLSFPAQRNSTLPNSQIGPLLLIVPTGNGFTVNVYVLLTVEAHYDDASFSVIAVNSKPLVPVQSVATVKIANTATLATLI